MIHEGHPFETIPVSVGENRDCSKFEIQLAAFSQSQSWDKGDLSEGVRPRARNI
jgi:hypothetical protein